MFIQGDLRSLPTPADASAGPNMSHFAPSEEAKFIVQSTSSDATGAPGAGFLINEVGSMHLTYTQANGAELLLLWCGTHLYVPPEHYPPPGVLPPLPADGKNIFKLFVQYDIFRSNDGLLTVTCCCCFVVVVYSSS